MFDSVYVPCPKCGRRLEFQSKGGECGLLSYTLTDAPEDVLAGAINNHTAECCGKTWILRGKVHVCAWIEEETPENETADAGTSATDRKE
jgi:hypothetical protein